jgi:PAS domain S-box-containing protein
MRRLCRWLPVAGRMQQADAVQARLHSVLDVIADGIVLIDAQGRVQAMNAAAMALFGHAWADVQGQHVAMLMPDRFADGPVTAPASESAQEVSGRRPDGTRFPLMLTLREAHIDGVRVFNGVVRGMPARQQAEGMLDHFSAIVNSSSDAIMSRDLDGLVTSWNPAAERLFGYSEQEMRGQSVDRLTPGEAMGREAEAMSRIARGLSVGHFETSRIKKNGTYFPVSCTLSPIRNADGRVIGAATIIRDVTDIKRQQAALKNSEETMRAAMEHAPIGMALVSHGGRWLRVNQALCDLLGYEREVLQLNDFQSITHPDDLAGELALIDQALDGEIRKYQLEKRFFHSSGRVVWVQLSMSLVLQDNAILPYFIAQINDITARREMERMKSEFVSIVSHELRTPLTSIRGSLGLIKGAMADEVSERARRLIDIAHSNCERLIVLINDILDIDKIASGQMRFEKDEVAMAPIVAQAVEGIQAYAEQFGVQVRVRRSDASLAAVVDTGRLMQVLANFLSNAVKFSPRGGMVEVDLTRYRNHVRIAVTDHGPGIAEDFKPHIFGKFMQADSTVTRAKGGTGLGLHIGKQIVEHMGGQVGFDSVLGWGATFWLTLPLVTMPSPVPAALTSDAARSLSPDQSLPRILHVEDDEDFALVVAEALRDRARITRASSLQDAVAQLRAQPFDAIVLDIGMPDGSGLCLLDEAPPLAGHAVPIVILSVAEVPDEVRRRVHAVLVKSRVSDQAMSEAILQAVASGEAARLQSA